ncbi:MAG: hypothetical protein R2828_07225 [Saprospiraceae bacterium]
MKGSIGRSIAVFTHDRNERRSGDTEGIEIAIDIVIAIENNWVARREVRPRISCLRQAGICILIAIEFISLFTASWSS